MTRQTPAPEGAGGAAQGAEGGTPALAGAPRGVAAGGRNPLLVRVVLGTALSAAVVALLAWDHAGRHRLGFTLLVAAAVGLGLDEFFGIVRTRGLRPAAFLSVSLAVFLVVMRGCAQPPVFSAVGLHRLDAVLSRLWAREGESLVLLIALLALLPQLVWARGRRSVEDLAVTCLGLAYVWLPLSFAFYLRSQWRIGETLIVLVAATSKVSDMAAYGCGRAFGRHTLAPAISPKKTWEGAVGGLVAGTAAGVAVVKLMIPGWGDSAGVWAGAAVFSAALAASGQVGDLVESAIKRWAGVKDSARRVPEFGGALDMIDSFLVSVPVASLWMLLGCGPLVFGWRGQG